MTTTSTLLPSEREIRRSFLLPDSTRLLHLVSTGLLIVAIAALGFVAFGPNGPGRGGNDSVDDPGAFGAVPGATIPDDAATSSIPYPNAEECTVEPMTRQESIEHFTDATAAYSDAQVPELPLDEPGSRPSEAEAEAIMQAYREWQACGLDTLGPSYQWRFQTPLFTATADETAFFYIYEPPYADYMIEGWINYNLSSAPPFSRATPATVEPIPARLPAQDDATPAADDPVRVVFSTIFPEDIWLFGPDHAMAQVNFVDPVTREIAVTSPRTLWFENVDGQWKLNFYSEGRGG